MGILLVLFYFINEIEFFELMIKIYFIMYCV